MWLSLLQYGEVVVVVLIASVAVVWNWAALRQAGRGAAAAFFPSKGKMRMREKAWLPIFRREPCTYTYVYAYLSTFVCNRVYNCTHPRDVTRCQYVAAASLFCFRHRCCRFHFSHWHRCVCVLSLIRKPGRKLILDALLLTPPPPPREFFSRRARRGRIHNRSSRSRSSRSAAPTTNDCDMTPRTKGDPPFS